MPLVRLESWEKLLTALQTDYTISIKDVCMALKSSRAWVNEYIKPHCRYVFVSNGIASTKATAPFTLFASKALGRNIKELVWLNRTDYENLLNSAVKSVTKQTISLPLSFFIPKTNAEFWAKFNALSTDFSSCKTINEMAEISEQIRNLKLEHIEEQKKPLFLCSEKIKANKRGEIKHIPCDLPPNYLNNLSAVHDLKDYGDTDETIYRNLFRQGAIKIEMCFVNESEKAGKKIFYVADENYIADSNNVCVPFEEYKRYISML